MLNFDPCSVYPDSRHSRTRVPYKRRSPNPHAHKPVYVYDIMPQAVLLTRRQDKGVVPVNIRHDRALSDSGVAERQPVPQAKMRARPLKLSFSSFRFFPLVSTSRIEPRASLTNGGLSPVILPTCVTHPPTGLRPSCSAGVTPTSS